MSEPHITVIGPGAIGGAIAGALVDAGHSPTIATRTRFDRLEVHVGGRTICADLPVVTDPRILGPADVVVLATKATQTTSAGDALRASCRPGTFLVIAQNGVQHREHLTPIVDPSVVLVPAVVNLPSKRTEAGNIRIGGRAGLTVEDNEAGRRIAELFDGSFLRVKTTDDWPSAVWTKLVINAAFGAIGVLTGKDNRVIEDPECRELARAIMAEILPVARAEGATLDDELPDVILSGVMKNAGGHISSIVVDRRSGTPTEWRERNQIVGIVGRRHGLATPLNDLATMLIRLGEPSDGQDPS